MKLLSLNEGSVVQGEAGDEILAIRARKGALVNAIGKKRSGKWLLRLWSEFIKARDGFRCLCCGTASRIQAHHVIRKVRCPWATLELGNGITLCLKCHKQVHAEFNQKPNVLSPLGAEQGDDQDEWAFLFGLLRDDCVARELEEEEFYYLSDTFLNFSISYQGYVELRDSVLYGHLSRIRFAHEIWRLMPERFYSDLGSDLLRQLMR